MRLLFIGDIVGEAGRNMVTRFVPQLRSKKGVDIVVANNENMAGGFGITPETFLEMSQAGVDVMTGGNHTFDKKEGVPVLEEESHCIRPANYPEGTPGRGSTLYTSPRGFKIGVINVMGRTFMDALDCPFRTADAHYEKLKAQTPVILVDIHAEATSEKVAMGWHFDGRASLVTGTHTHVQTADERVLPGGTAYITDAGMTGPYDSVIGVKKEIVIQKVLTKRGRRFETASGDPWLCGVIVDIDENTGRASHIERVRIEAGRTETHP
jgi:metallophosphoesterase (TIGR00282 family)